MRNENGIDNKRSSHEVLFGVNTTHPLQNSTITRTKNALLSNLILLSLVHGLYMKSVGYDSYVMYLPNKTPYICIVHIVIGSTSTKKQHHRKTQTTQTVE